MNDTILKVRTSPACGLCHNCCITWPQYYKNTKGKIVRLRWKKYPNGTYFSDSHPKYLKDQACYMLGKDGKCKLYGKRRPEPCTQYLCEKANQSILAEGAGQ